MRLSRIALSHLSVRHVAVWQRVAAVGLLASLLMAPLTFDAAQARPAKKNAEASAGQDASTAKKRSARVGKTRSRAAGGWNRPNYAAIVVDDKTGQVLHEANADAPRHPASMTKVMTLYLLFEQLEAGHLQLDSELPICRVATDRHDPSPSSWRGILRTVSARPPQPERVARSFFHPDRGARRRGG
jgi:D-alanyl-D-alanine carboxypeptidase